MISTEVRVSVLLPVRDGARYVSRAIDSILSQTLSDFELIVVDDGSTDGTADIVRSHSAADSRIRLVAQPPLGLVSALETGRRLARAPLIARLDADDIALPDRLKLQCAYMDRHPATVAVGGQTELINQHGRLIGSGRYPVDAAACRRHLSRGSPFCHSAVMMRAAAAEACGGYRHRFSNAEDYDLWLRMARKGDLANLAVPVAHYRIHAQSLTATNAIDNSIATALALIEDRYPESLAALEAAAGEGPQPLWPSDWAALEPYLPSSVKIFGLTAYLRSLALNGAITGARETSHLLQSVQSLVKEAKKRRGEKDLMFMLSRAALQIARRGSYRSVARLAANVARSPGFLVRSLGS